MNRQARLFLVLGALVAALSVILSAYIAHAPGGTGGAAGMVQTALAQQQFHALGLLVTGLCLERLGRSRWLIASGWLMVAGVILFSLNILARALLGFEALRALVPWGGMAFILGWVAMAAGVLSVRRDPNPSRGVDR